MIRYGSVCSGIEAVSVAWRPLGWECQWVAEVDPTASMVLKHHYPHTKNHGDFTKIQAGSGPDIDVLVGGPPCQSFSGAGLRGGLDDPRGNLTLEFLELAGRLRPRWVVFENVAGILSSTCHKSPDPSPPPDPVDMEREGQEVVVEDDYDSEELHAFSTFLARIPELGYGWAYRILDSQYVGGCPLHGDWRTRGPVPQRRRRVFVVAYSGDPIRMGGRPSDKDIERFSRISAAVLLERESLCGHPAEGIGQEEETADCPEGFVGLHNLHVEKRIGAFGGGSSKEIDVATTCCAHGGRQGRIDFDAETFIAHIPPVLPESVICFQQRGRDDGHTLEWTRDKSCAITVSGDTPTICFQVAGGCNRANISSYGVRKLTPVECERLQGFPDGWTAIPVRSVAKATKKKIDQIHREDRLAIIDGVPWETLNDGARYKLIGNSMTTFVMSWIGRRIQVVEEILAAHRMESRP